MHKVMYVLMAATLAGPTLAEAQTKHKRPTPRTVRVVRTESRDCCWGNRFSFEPYAGVMKDAYDASPDDENAGYLLGFRVGYLLSSRSRLLGNIAYSQVDDVANPNGLTSYNVYDNTWVFTTAGAEFDVVPGNTAVSLGLQGGVAWRKVDYDGSVGPIPPPVEDDDNFSAYEVVIPSVSIRQRLAPRTTLSIGLHDKIFDVFEGPAQHSLALTAGISFR
jgi:hypothetical protein